MIDILVSQETYPRFEICSVDLISGGHNPADGLSKLEDNRMLQRLVYRSMDDTQILQWIDSSDLQASTDSTKVIVG